MQMLFTGILTDAYGDEFDEPVEGGRRKLTLGRACVMALNSSAPSDAVEEEGKRYERGMLAYGIAQAEKGSTLLDLTSEQVTLIKKRVAIIYLNADVVRAVWMKLDPPSTPST